MTSFIRSFRPLASSSARLSRPLHAFAPSPALQAKKSKAALEELEFEEDIIEDDDLPSLPTSTSSTSSSPSSSTFSTAHQTLHSSLSSPHSLLSHLPSQKTLLQSLTSFPTESSADALQLLALWRKKAIPLGKPVEVTQAVIGRLVKQGKAAEAVKVLGDRRTYGIDLAGASVELVSSLGEGLRRNLEGRAIGEVARDASALNAMVEMFSPSGAEGKDVRLVARIKALDIFLSAHEVEAEGGLDYAKAAKAVEEKTKKVEIEALLNGDGVSRKVKESLERNLKEIAGKVGKVEGQKFWKELGERVEKKDAK
ncbi:hypothetical protein P7C70_g8326, partial [Phenoliferia sp. Uapishka_3]